MITCIAIDDEPLALRQIEGYITMTPYLKLLGSFSNALKAMEFLNDNSVDLMFVDINMPDLTGMEFVKALSNPPKVIFTTAYREYAVEGFQVDAADYLVKPIAYADFLKSTDKTKERFFSDNKGAETVHNNDQFLFIKSEYKIIRISYKDILYAEGMRDYVRIHLENQKPVMALMSIKKMQQHLPDEAFMRVHRSFIVHLNKITTIERNRIIFDGKVFIPISDQYKEQFQDFLDNNFLK
ncbi:LytR/AlgR family response regulator transcription factor [Saccharicrinis fermentans]|uniref:Putative transcriptional regulatory protein YehT n=1 Tax=Saccharicrinis fermentans DSM 9555 = JCM 21142 TaxID=869213 RepID=W7YB58_9BACT|nr:LytTR family DNA-binding domain-containing protein [Saccharicrinis fermentans]GAF01611.1 putative transcriptional regulatory protein YehT [Saccharicrinis fermentans DSM 9555 = JCM 21142]